MTELQSNTDEPVVRAIDLGYGFTKLTDSVDINGMPNVMQFPSIALKQTKKNLGAGFLAERNTVEVVHKGVTYEVGADAILMAKDKDTRNLNDDYIKTNDYAALMKGALKLMNEPVIDMLVLGTPVNGTPETTEYLKETWKGLIELDNETSVVVKNVKVIPQPLGGFVLHGLESNTYRKLKKQTNLVIDPGFLTVDWIIVSDLKVIDGDSDDRGMGVILNEIANRVGAGANNLQVINRIDKALQGNMKLQFKGDVIDLNQYLPYVDDIVQKSVETLATRIGGTGSIQNVILLGGAAHLYKSALESRLEGFKITVPEGSSYANVLGYHSIGVSQAYQKG